ncbi:WD40-repeat-containing domain protein [Dipodascopsis uninucleata]
MTVDMNIDTFSRLQIGDYSPFRTVNNTTYSGEEKLIHPAVQKQIDFVKCFPSEISTQIFAQLPLQAVVNCMLVSKCWSSMVDSNTVWKSLFKQQKKWRVKKNVPKNVDWKRLYRTRHELEIRWHIGVPKPTSLSGHDDSVYCVQFDDEKIITGSRDRSIRIWDTESGRLLKTLGAVAESEVGSGRGHDRSVLCLQFDDKIMVSGSSDSSFIIWDMQTYEMLHRVFQDTSVLDVALDEKHVITCSKSGKIYIWDRNDGYKLKNTIHVSDGAVNAIHLRRKYLASVGQDRSVKLWNVETGQLMRKFVGHERGLACVQLSSDLSICVSGGNDNSIRVWDVKSGKCLKVYRQHVSLVRALHLDGYRLVSGSYDQTVKVWDLERDCPILDFEKFHGNWVFSVQADSKRVVAASFGTNPVVFDFSQGLEKEILAYLE